MGKIHGTPLWAIIVATIGFYILGFLWYSLIFGDMWKALSGISETEAQAHAAALGNMRYVWGIVITLLQVLGLNYILHQSNSSAWKCAVKMGAKVALLIALPLMAYGVLYSDYSFKLLLIDIGHILIGYMAVCAFIVHTRNKESENTENTTESN